MDERRQRNVQVSDLRSIRIIFHSKEDKARYDVGTMYSYVLGLVMNWPDTVTADIVSKRVQTSLPSELVKERINLALEQLERARVRGVLTSKHEGEVKRTVSLIQDVFGLTDEAR